MNQTRIAHGCSLDKKVHRIMVTDDYWQPTNAAVDLNVDLQKMRLG